MHGCFVSGSSRDAKHTHTHILRHRVLIENCLNNVLIKNKYLNMFHVFYFIFNHNHLMMVYRGKYWRNTDLCTNIQHCLKWYKRLNVHFRFPSQVLYVCCYLNYLFFFFFSYVRFVFVLKNFMVFGDIWFVLQEIYHAVLNCYIYTFIAF